MKKSIAVIFGGNSAEHEISIITAMQVIENADQNKMNIVPIYITKDNHFYTSVEMKNIKAFQDIEALLKKATEIDFVKINYQNVIIKKKNIFLKKKVISPIDMAILCVHGTNIEDGSLAGYLDLKSIPYAGSKVLGAAIGQDKIIMKDIFIANQLPVVQSFNFNIYDFQENEDEIKARIQEFGFPVILKPANLGSSIGIQVAKNINEFIEAANQALQFDNKILVERLLTDFYEVNCSVLGNQKHAEVSVLEKVITEVDFLTYEEKYQSNKKKMTSSQGMASLKREIPANVDQKIIEEVQNLALKVFKVLNLSGVVRIDFIICQNKIYVNEANTIPGSLSYYLWEKSGYSFSQLIDRLIQIGYEDYKLKQNSLYTIETNVLKNVDLNNIKK